MLHWFLHWFCFGFALVLHWFCVADNTIFLIHSTQVRPSRSRCGSRPFSSHRGTRPDAWNDRTDFRSETIVLVVHVHLLLVLLSSTNQKPKMFGSLLGVVLI